VSAVTRQLARAESRRLLLSPFVLIGAALMLALRTTLSWSEMPVWNQLALDLSGASVLLAGAVLVAVQLAASREHRYGMVEVLDSLPTPARRRTAGLLAAAPVMAVPAAVVAGVHLLAQVPYGIAGTPPFWELANAVLIPVVGAVAGVALGRWLRGTAGVFVGFATAAVVVVVVEGLGATPDNPARWLALVPASGFTEGLDVPPRPSGWHLAYLLALAVAIGGVALVHRRHWLVPLSVVCVAVACAAGSSVVQINSQPAAFEPADHSAYRGAAAHDCASRGEVTYCPYHHYGGWVPAWRAAVDPVVAALPASARNDLPVVRQRFLSGYEFKRGQWSDAVWVFTRWGRHGAAASSRAELAASFAAAVTGLPSKDELLELANGEPISSCWAGGQARTTVALWLAAQALPDGAARLRSHSLRVGAAAYGQDDIDAAFALLTLPHGRVTAGLGRGWEQSTRPTARRDVLTAIGLPASVAGRGMSPAAARRDMPTCP